MNLEEIRRTFDKGSLIFDKDKMSVFYVCVDGCGISQSIANAQGHNEQRNYKAVFEKLISVSDELVFRVLPGGKMYIDFSVLREHITDQTCWFLPITKSLTKEDYIRIQKEAGSEVLPEYQWAFDKHFKDFGSADEAERKSLAYEWLAFISRSNTDYDEIRASHVRWPRLVDACRRFFGVVPLGKMVISDPEPDAYGFVEFQITAEKATKCRIIGANKALFLSMVERSDSVGIEMTTDGGKITFVDLDFFS